MSDQFSLDGKVALLTGSSRGLGFAMAEALAAHGARVVLNGRFGESLEAKARSLTERGLEAEALAFDVTDGGRSPMRCRTSPGATAGSTSWSTMPASSTGRRSPTGPTRTGSG
jgi:NAD(P)-dependent dehydrogenase (short-subunit alcohol dehydrogenase family)